MSKEEIEKSKRNVEKVLETDPLTATIDFQYYDVFVLLEYIQQLETKEQKVIDNLEAEIKADEEDLKYNNLTEYGRGCLDEAKEILEIMKGEESE